MTTTTSSYTHVLTIQNNKRIKVSEVTAEDIDEVVQVISMNFGTFNPLYYHLQIPVPDIIKYFRRIIERSMSERMAYKGVDLDNNKVVGASIHYDLYYAQINPIDSSGLHPRIYEIRKMHDTLGPKMYPKKPGAIICAALGAVHSDYYGLGIINKFGQFFWEEHPTQSLFPIVYSLTTSPLSTKMNLAHGYRRYKAYHPKDYVNEKGERPFATIDDTVKKLGIRDYEGVVVTLRDNYLRAKL